MNLNDIQALVIDMDGVLWRGNEPLPGRTQFFDLLRERSLPFVLATNNAGKTPEQYLQKLSQFGIVVEPDQILTSALATAAYMKNEFEPGTRVFVVGQDGLLEALRQAGLTLATDSSQPAGAVVVGIDFFLTYDKLKHAAFLIQRGARFIGCNGDLTFPAEGGLTPGTGSILAAIKAATGVDPTVVGKPNRLMFDIAAQKLGRPSGQIAMIGDRLETDILGGQQAGFKTILVTTGVDSRASIPEKGIQPDAVFSGIEALAAAWRAAGR